MNLGNTQVFALISGFVRDLWLEPTGKIFLVTIIAYSVSYLIYSGYLSWFSGGFGSISPSQMGFTVIDFLSLLPTVYLLLIRTIFGSLTKIAVVLVTYVIAPFLIAFLIGFIIGEINLLLFFTNTTIKLVGALLWAIGMAIGINHYFENARIYRPSIILSYLGALVLGFSNIFYKPTYPVNTPQSVLSTNWLDEVLISTILFLIPLLLYFAGLLLASMTVKDKLLSKVTRVIVSSPIDINGLIREKKIKPQKPEIFSYTATSQTPIYLFSTFSKTTMLYLPHETTKKEHGALILLSNDVIKLIEIKSGKVEDN